MTTSISYKNTPVYYRTTGKGPWVILVHGFLESSEIWDDFAAMLEKDFSVLMVDLPGHGRSGVAGDVHTMEMMAESITAVADHLGINEFAVAGHSMGGYVSLELAARYPERVKGLVLFHSHAAPDDEKTKDNRRRTIDIVNLNRSNFIYHFIPDLFAEENREKLSEAIGVLQNRAGATSAKGIVAALEGMRERKGGLDLLMSSSMPFLFVIGKQDSRMPYNKILAQAMLPSHAEILLLDKVGHMGFLEAPEVALPVIRDFFRRNLL